MSKKIELKVQIFCEKCKTTILTTAAKLEGVNSISLDADKGVLTIIGTADAVELVQKLKKAKISTEIISFGPEKTEEKKEDKKEEENDEKKIECQPFCYCKQPLCYGKQPSYGFPQVVCYEQYPENNCTIF